MHSDRPRGVGETKEARKMGRRKKDSRWRTYSEQQQCPKRSSAVSSTLNNSPASPDMTLADKLPFGLVTESPVFGDLMDTLAGPYCYRYE